MAILDTINCYMSYLLSLKWNKWILAFNFENSVAQWCMTGGISTMYHSKAWWSYFTMKVWLQLYIPALGHSLPLFQGSVFFLDALYTRNSDSERSMINATTFERRFEKRLQRRFDYGYWNVFLLLEKVINAPYVCLFSHGCIDNSLLIDKFCFCSLFMIWNENK